MKDSPRFRNMENEEDVGNSKWRNFRSYLFLFAFLFLVA